MITTTPATKKPWERRRWRGGIARGWSGASVLVGLLNGVAFAAVVAFLGVKEGRKILHEEWMLGIFILFFTAGAIGFSAWGLVALARWCRFGRCRVRMATMPGVIGGHFAGEVELPDSFPNHTDVRLELFCLSTRQDPGSRAVWSRSQCVRTSAVHWRGPRRAIPFDFTIPYNLPDAPGDRGDKGVSDSYNWRLRVTSRLAGADLDMEFVVPVFRTEASNPALTQVLEEDEDRKPLDDFLKEQGEWRRLRIEHGPGGWNEYVGLVTPVRGEITLLMGAMGLAFAVVPAVLLANLFTTGEIMVGIFVSLIAIPCFAFSMLFLYLAVRSLIERRTWVANGFIHQRRSLFGLSLPSRSAACDKVRTVDVGSTSSSGRKSYADVVVSLETGADSGGESGIIGFLRDQFASIPVATDMLGPETKEVIAMLRKEINRQRTVPLREIEEESEEEGEDDTE